MANLGPLDRCQVGGCCCVYAVLSCIRLSLQREKNNNIPSLQDPISCCLSNGDTWKGWKAEDVLKYVQEHGLPVEGDYPFTGVNSRCLVHKPLAGEPAIERRIRIGGYEVCTLSRGVNGVRELKDLIRTHGAVVATIFVGEEFGHESCQPLLDNDGMFKHLHSRANEEKEIVGHAVMITDHKKIKGKGCWLVKNWFGPDWGLNGYFKIDDRLTYLIGEVAYLLSVTCSKAANEEDSKAANEEEN